VYAAIKRLVANSDAPSVRLLMSRMAQMSIFYSRIATVAPEPNEELGDSSFDPQVGLWNSISSIAVAL